jgi:hypothetical protein
MRRLARAQVAAPIRECGDYAPGGGAGVYNITTRVTSCRIARRMARRFTTVDGAFLGIADPSEVATTPAAIARSLTNSPTSAASSHAGA